MQIRTMLTVCAGAALLALAGCGDDDEDVAAAGGTVTISSATPATHNTTIDLSKSQASGNDARPADLFSSQPYCEIFGEGAPGANGQVYAVQVYFRQSDKQPLHVSVVGGSAAQPPTYTVWDHNNGNPITGVSVDTAARKVTFTNKALAGSGGQVGTLNGSAIFDANSTGVAACGV